MRLLADECIAGMLIKLLRQSGMDIEAVAELAPGSADEEVLRRSVKTERLLLTADYDFPQLIFRFGRKALGVVVLSPALSEIPVKEVAATIIQRLAKPESAFAGKLTVLEKDRTRQRALPD
jgi:predicted nuclease of predicted toxin-antitoxin system